MALPKYTPGKTTPSSVSGKSGLPQYSPTKTEQKPTYTAPMENNRYSLADPADGSVQKLPKVITLDQPEEVKPKKPSFSQEVMKRVSTSLLFGPIAPILNKLSNTKKGKEVTSNLDTVKQSVLDATVNQPKVQKAILNTANSTTNVVPAVKAIFGEAFDMGRGQQDTEDVFDRFNRYKVEFDKKASDPNNTFGEDLGYSLAKSGPQTITGVLLGMIPFVGPTASSTYFGTVSAASQIEEEGKVTSPLKIAIDTVGDRLLGNGIETLLKKPSTELIKTGFIPLAKNVLKSAGTEGGTEVGQSFLKYSVDYQNAKTDEEKLAVVQKAKDYAMNGGMFLEFTTGAILGGTVGGVAGQYSPEQTNYIPRKTLARDDDKEFTPAQNEVREKVRNSVATELDNGTDPGVIAKGLSDATGADIQITMQIVNEIQQDIEPEQKQTQDIDIQAIIDEASAVAKQTVEEKQNAPVDGKLPTVDVDMAKIENMADEVLYGAIEPVQTPVETPKTVQKEQKSAKEEPVKITTQQAEDVKSMITSLKQEGYSDFEMARELQKKQNLSIDDAIKLIQRYQTQTSIEPVSQKLDTEIDILKGKGKELNTKMIDKLVERGYDRAKLENMTEGELGKTWNESVKETPKTEDKTVADNKLFSKIIPILNKDIKVTPEEARKILMDSIGTQGYTEKDLLITFTDEKIDGDALGAFYINKYLQNIISLYEKNGKVSLIAALHESKHFLFKKLSAEMQREALDQAKKDIGPLSDFVIRTIYKPDGIYAGETREDALLEEYIVDKWAKTEAKDYGYTKSIYGRVFTALDNILKTIVTTYKKVSSLFSTSNATKKPKVVTSLEKDIPESQKIDGGNVDITQTKEFKNWFGDWENNSQNSSKIVDEDGKPLIVYHGTNVNTFTVFDKNKIGSRDSGWYGKGFYFSLTKGEAQYYGKNIVEAYLNIRNPFIFDQYQQPDFKGYSLADTYYLANIVKIVPELGDKITGYIYEKSAIDGTKYGTEITFNEYLERVNKENLSAKPVKFETRTGVEEMSYEYFDIYGKEQWFDSNLTKSIPEDLLKYVLFDKKYGTSFDISGLYGVERAISSAYGSEFTNKLKELGYDGTMQSKDGDEYVAFEPNQIKSIDNTKFGSSNDIKEQTKNKVRTKKGFVSSQEALEKAMNIPIFKELQSRGQVVLSEKLNNPKALASYYKGIIKFINNPHETTLPHEAFHAFADLVLTTDEKATALDLVRESGMGDLQAEEKLAQDFAEWYVGKQKKTALEKIFDKIKAFFNKLVGNKNEIEALFESVLDEKLVRSINSFEKLGGIEALRAEYNQSPEEFTYELFEKSDIWKKPNLKKATIIGALGSLRKPLMKEFVATKLDTDFAGQDVIDTEELRRSIYSDLLDMKIIETKKYADYGLGNIGRHFTSDRSYNTYILNTNFLHGRTGHFSGDFETTTTKDDLEIRVIPAGMHQGQRVEKDQYYVTTKNLSAANLLEGTFGKFDTRDEAQAYIDGFSDMTHQQPGLFGHFRAFNEDDTFNVVEMQSDVFQDLSASYFRSNKRLMDNELKIVQDNINEIQNKIDELKKSKERFDREIENIEKEIDFTKKNNPQQIYSIEVNQEKIDGYKKRIKETDEEIAKKKDYIDRQEKELEKIRDKYTSQPEGVYFGKQGTYSDIVDYIEILQEAVDKASDTGRKNLDGSPNRGMYLNSIDIAIRNLEKNKMIENSNIVLRLFAPTKNEMEKVDINLSDFSDQYIQELTNEKTKYGVKNRQIIKQKLEEIITEAKGNLPSKEEFLKLTPQEEREIKLSEQFISFKNNYYETIINSTIRQAAMSDARVIRFATPYTVANVEGYIVGDEYDDPESSFTEEEINNIGVGGSIETLGGYDGIITAIYNDSYEVAYAEKDLSSAYSEDDIIDGEKENRYSEFNYNEDIDDVKEKLREYIDNYPNLSIKPLGEELTQDILKTIDEAKNIESLENIPGFEDVKEEIIDDYMENFDPYEHMRDIYSSNGFASYEDRGTTYYIDAGGNDVNTETLAYKTSFSGSADEFKLSDIQNEEHQAIAAKYGTDDDGKDGAFLKYIKRKRKDLREVIDDNGFSWYESNITPEDKASVELYQTEDQLASDDEWQEHEIDIMTGDVKAEDLKPVDKNPVFDTGDKVEDARRTLLFAENRVGVEPQPIRKVTVSGINKVPLPQALQTEALRLELEQESLDISPLKTLQVHENKKEGRLGEVLGRNFDYGKVNKVSEWQRRGDEIVNNGDFLMYADENGFVSTEVVREAYGDWRDKTKRLQEDKKEYKYKVKSFKENTKDSLAMQKLAEQEDKKYIAELDKNAKLEEKRKRQEDKKAIFEQGLANAKAEEFKRQERIRVINNAKIDRVPELSRWAKLVGQKLNPLKYTDRTTQNIFKNWNSKVLKGSIRADREAQAFTKIPANQGFDVIQKYEAGTETPYTAQIKTKFDALLKEARERGVEFGFRKNYIPHVYRENTEQIKKAIRKYLADKGLTEDMINAYENGEQLPEAIVNTLKINPFFSKERVFPSYEVAMKYGLTPKYTSVAQLVGHYIEELETIVANNELIEELSSTGKILPFGEAPLGWKPVQLPPATQGYMANLRVAKVIDGLFGDQETVGFWKIGAYISKKMQQIKLSAGVPYTTVNFFAIGAGLIKEITAGNFKAVNAFYRANFNRKSMEWFQENTKYVAMMANQGIDLRKTIDSWEALHSTIKDIKARGGKKSDSPYVMDEEFDRAFSDKTFMAFMPMLQVQLFKDVYNKFIEKGYTPTIAEEFAGKVIVKNFGITEFNARSQKTKDQLSTIFFAPQFREGVINALYNTGASGVDFVKNLGGLRGQLDPTMTQNRKLLAGMILTFALYNLLNAALNDDDDDENGKEWMWDNPKNRKFALQIPADDGTLVYVEFMPSFLAFARNIFSGTAYLATGEFDKAQQKFGTLFSMPVKVTTEILANADYFDRPIYKETDTGPQKAKKISKYLGLSVMHPYITETVNQIEDKKPLYQSIITGAELPLKFSTKEKVATGEYYDALEKKAKENARAKEKVMPKYESIKELKDQGKHKQALDEYNKLTDEEKLVYNKIKENPYEKKQQKVAIYEESIESLKTKSLQQVENEIAKTMYGDKPTASQKSTVAKDFGFYKEFNDYKYKIKAEELKGLNNESKILYLKKMKSEMTPKEYQEFISKGRKMVRLSSGKTSPILISDEVLKVVR